MKDYTYVIELPPVTKKNSSQIVRAHGRPMLIPSKPYREYTRNAGNFLEDKPVSPIDYPVNVKCLFYMPTKRRVDITNLWSAVCDVLVDHNILADDNCKIVFAMDGSRVRYSKLHPRTEITITPIVNEEVWSEE